MKIHVLGVFLALFCTSYGSDLKRQQIYERSPNQNLVQVSYQDQSGNRNSENVNYNSQLNQVSRNIPVNQNREQSNGRNTVLSILNNQFQINPNQNRNSQIYTVQPGTLQKVFSNTNPDRDLQQIQQSLIRQFSGNRQFRQGSEAFRQNNFGQQPTSYRPNNPLVQVSQTNARFNVEQQQNPGNFFRSSSFDNRANRNQISNSQPGLSQSRNQFSGVITASTLAGRSFPQQNNFDQSRPQQFQQQNRFNFNNVESFNERQQNANFNNQNVNERYYGNNLGFSNNLGKLRENPILSELSFTEKQNQLLQRQNPALNNQLLQTNEPLQPFLFSRDGNKQNKVGNFQSVSPVQFLRTDPQLQVNNNIQSNNPDALFISNNERSTGSLLKQNFGSQQDSQLRNLKQNFQTQQNSQRNLNENFEIQQHSQLRNFNQNFETQHNSQRNLNQKFETQQNFQLRNQNQNFETQQKSQLSNQNFEAQQNFQLRNLNQNIEIPQDTQARELNQNFKTQQISQQNHFNQNAHHQTFSQKQTLQSAFPFNQGRQTIRGQIESETNNQILGEIKPFSIPKEAQLADGIIDSQFSCANFGQGFFADSSSNCRMFHVCSTVRDVDTQEESSYRFTFQCGANSFFDQSTMECVQAEPSICQSVSSLYTSTNEQFRTLFRDLPSRHAKRDASAYVSNDEMEVVGIKTE